MGFFDDTLGLGGLGKWAEQALWARAASAWQNALRVGGSATSNLSGHIGKAIGEDNWNTAKPWVAAAAGTALGGLGGSALISTATAGAGAAVSYDWARDRRGEIADERTDDELTTDIAASSQAQQREKDINAAIVAQTQADEAKRRAQALANGRKGTVRTSPLGLPGGGFAQKQLLGA